MRVINEDSVRLAVRTLAGQDGMAWLARAIKETIAANTENVDVASQEVIRLTGTYIVETSQHQHLSTLMRGFGESLREQASSHEHYTS
jgi:hypothetical protein